MKTIRNYALITLCIFMQWCMAQDTAFISIFNEEIYGTRNDQISIQFQYGVSSADITSTVVGTGSIQAINSMAVISSGAGTTASAQIQSVDIASYKPGHETDLFFTAFFPNGSAANSTQWIGLFDINNGIAIGFNGTTFSILLRNNAVDTTIPQSSFNGDPLDGTGPSGFVLNTANINVFRIAFGWLGAAPIMFQIIDQNGDWITFHTIILSNTIQAPTFSNPILPMTAQVTKTNSNTTDLQIRTASWNAANIISQQPSPALRDFAVSSSVIALNATGLETHLLTLQNKTTFQSKPNKIRVTIEIISGGTTSTSFLLAQLVLRKNAIVNGLILVDVDSANSVTQYSTSGTYVAGTGSLLLTLPGNAYGSGPINLLSGTGNIDVFINPGESLTVTGKDLSGGGNTGFASLAWYEQF